MKMLSFTCLVFTFALLLTESNYETFNDGYKAKNKKSVVQIIHNRETKSEKNLFCCGSSNTGS